MDQPQSKFKVGEIVTIPLYNLPEHKEGEVIEVCQHAGTHNGFYYNVRRRDGRVVALDESEIERPRVGYHEQLDPDRQITTEEHIAALIAEQRGSDYSDSTCAELGRDILYLVLREFRPDLFDDRPVAAGKYGTPESLADKLYPGEPFFAILGRDFLCPTEIENYRWQVEARYEVDGRGEVSDDFIQSLGQLGQAVVAWQKANPDKVKLPD